MKYFEQDSRYNFVDENNVYVGYDAYDACCENFGWYVADEVRIDNYHEEVDLTDYRFDPSFHEVREKEDESWVHRIAVFKIVNVVTSAVKYLHLFNDHNGYYAHGFTRAINEIADIDGVL